MSKMLNIGAALAAASVGSAVAARVRVLDGTVQIRFGDRRNTSNLPKGEMIRPIGVKGSGRRISLPNEIADALDTVPVVLIPGKYGWFSIDAAAPTATADGRVSAK